MPNKLYAAKLGELIVQAVLNAGGSMSPEERRTWNDIERKLTWVLDQIKRLS